MPQFKDGTQVALADTSREPQRCWQKFDPATVVLPNGWEREPGYRPLPVETIWQRDTPIRLRDGTVLYADIFRAKAFEHTPLPAVISYSPFGKTDKGFSQVVNLNVGVPRSRLSGLESFEGLDPAEWCQRGYAIVNVDARGVYESEGDMAIHGKQEGQDGADVVEWIAQQPWSNGSVGMAGNSWLAACQWWIAMEKPPHLKAIAPWEGATDFRRHVLERGGIGNFPFINFLFGRFAGLSKREDAVEMVKQYPLWNDYWEDKSVIYDQLDLPMYIVASYSTALHAEGSIKAYNYSRSKDKWLRIHGTQEWHDLYSPDNVDDLQRFFDRYLLGKKNDWEATPRVRLSLLRFNGPPIKNRPEITYPPPRVEYHPFYLKADDKTLVPDRMPSTKEFLTYAAQNGEAHFSYRFSEYTEVIGFTKAILYMSTDAGDDMDVYVVIRKLDADGNALINLNIPLQDYGQGATEADVPNQNIHKFIGHNGQLRASWRHTLPEEPHLSADARRLTTPGEVTLCFTKQEKLHPDQIVKLEIQIWPAGVVFQPGESLRFEIKGQEIMLPEIAAISKKANPNTGNHTIYISGEHPSHLILPVSH